MAETKKANNQENIRSQQSNDDFGQVVAVSERVGDYCLAGDLAANCYTEPISTTNADFILTVSAWGETRRLLEEMGFVIQERLHSLLLSRPTSQWRIRVSNDPCYADFPKGSKAFEVLGCSSVRVVRLEDLVKVTTNAWSDPQRPRGERAKAEFNLFRIGERYPGLRPKMPEAFRDDGFDVVERQKMWRFKVKRAEWLVWLDGDDEHSIWRQLTSLLSDYSLFRTVNELRLQATQCPVEGVGFNEPVMRLLDRGFVATQAMGIRRLLDKRKDVISLRRLVDDLEHNLRLMTREVYLAIRRLPYDAAAARVSWEQKMIATGQFEKVKGIATEGSAAWRESERAHERFDELSETTPTSRSRVDVVSPSRFKELGAKLDGCEDMLMFATKYIAHAADPGSRLDLTDVQTGMTLRRLEACLKVLVQVTEFVSPLLQSDSSVGVAKPQFDVAENLDKSWVAPAQLDDVRGLFGRNCEAIEQWRSERLW